MEFKVFTFAFRIRRGVDSERQNYSTGAVLDLKSAVGYPAAPANLARSGRCNNSLVQQNTAEATAATPKKQNPASAGSVRLVRLGRKNGNLPRHSFPP